MATPTFNAGKDYAGLETATTNAVAVKSSGENRSNQVTEGTNGKGDVAAQDVFGSTADPSTTYEVVKSFSGALPALGTVKTHDDFANPLMIVSYAFSFSAKNPGTLTATLKMIEPNGTTNRTYATGNVSFTARHRAQDILNALTIKKKSGEEWTNVTDDTEADITAATATFSVDPTIGQPKGVTSSSDCSGGKVVAQFTVGCWIAGELDFVAAEGFTITAEKTRTDPENGYSEYTVTLSKGLTGTDAVTLKDS